MIIFNKMNYSFHEPLRLCLFAWQIRSICSQIKKCLPNQFLNISTCEVRNIKPIFVSRLIKYLIIIGNDQQAISSYKQKHSNQFKYINQFIRLLTLLELNFQPLSFHLNAQNTYYYACLDYIDNTLRTHIDLSNRYF